jgi:hypothetical protein
MHLVGKIGGHSVVVLIDIGSTHSFMDQNVAKKFKLPAREESKLTVMVVNGATLPCLGYYKVVSFKRQGHSFTTNIYLLSLGGCDMVLGIDCENK